MDFPNSKGSYNELQVASTGAMPTEDASGFSEETIAFLDTLDPAERQKAIEEINAPLTGEDVAEALRQDADYVPEEADYLKFVAFNKTRETSIIDGIGAGASAVLGDLGRAVGAVADHPLKALSQAPASLIEAFAQGTRNLYGMVAQSSDPNSILFGFKNAIAGDGTAEGYQQFLEARRFNKHSAALASGEETIIMDKNVIDKDITLAMSYIADPTLFIPFGSAASAGMRAVGMGEKLTMLAARSQSLKASVIGGGLKWGVGAPIEAVGAVTRGTIDKAIAVGGNVLETATGMSTKELQATARMSAVGTTTASVMGGHIPVASSISNVYLGAGAAAGVGEAVGAVGEQIMKQGFTRGYNSFAREALLQTPNLSGHAKGLLKVLDAVDPMFSYGYGMAEGAAQGAVVGGGLGYLSGGADGLGQGIGAGMALGGTGAVAGRAFADISGGTKMARAEVQGGFVLENMRADKHPNLAATETYLLDATLKGDRAGALQVIAGLDRIAPDMRLIVDNAQGQVAFLKSKGLDADGHKVDPVTGAKLLGADGKPIQFEAPLAGFYGGEGFVMHTEKDGNGKKQVTVVINTDATSKNVMHHELFHAVFKTTVMEPMFRERFSEAILGKFDANGIKVKPSEIDPKEFKAFATRELRNTVDTETGKKLSELPEKLRTRLALFDTHLAEYQKAGSTSRMNPESAKALDYLVEEFGAHYATQFMKGKPVDYLFYGAEYTGMRGVMDRLHNGFLDFWQKSVTKQNPTFGDFTGDKTFDKSFGPNDGKRTLAQRSSAIDYMVQDLLRSVAGKRKGSTNSFDVRTLEPVARAAFFNSNGMDGFKHYFDKDGKRRNITEDQVKAERIQVGKAVHDSLSKLDPKEVAGIKDVEGSFVANSTVGTKFSDTMLAHLVKEGHISDLLAERIKNIQEITSGNGSNVISYLYKGDSMELEVGPNSKRVYGADVPVTSRNTIVVGYEIKVKKDGTMSLLMKGLDKNLIDARGNEQWAKPEVRDLWSGDRNEFDKSFFEYLSNASKASTDMSRVESSLLPSLARGDGFGAERRNIMHQFLGMAKRKGEKYFNTPIAEIPRGNTSTVFNQRIDFMSPVKSDLPIRYDFNLDNAHSDLSRNYKVSDMEHEATPQGDVFIHASKYKIVADKQGAANLYDADGKMLGAFKDKDLAGKAMEKAYTAERVETEKRIERVIADQQKQQQTFKVWDDETIAKARELGDIFETDAGKAFHAGTELIRQTREEFYSDNFIKLRQAEPDVALQAVEQVMARVNKIEQLKTQLEDAFYATKEPNAVKKNIKRQELMNVSAHLQRYNDIRLAYTRATRNGQRNGQVILDYINTHRRTSTGYDNMAKVFFGDQYDSQFQTGKPVTTVATHGTNSNELLTYKEFDASKLGSRHMNPNDRVGVFLSGETKTSFGYADPKEGEMGYRQVRAAIKFNNPFVLDYGFECFDGAKYDRIFKQARAGGHDGIVIKNVYDGGSADTVFIVMADKVKENTAIIDTHIGMERVTRQSEQVGSVSADSDQGSVRYPIQESVPRGKDVRIGTGIGLSWKVADGVARETGYDKFLKEAGLSGRLRKGVDSAEFAGRPVVLINYDNSGVWNLIDSSTGEVISTIQGGALHNIISGKINSDKQAAVLASVNAAGLKGIESVRQKSIKAGKPLTFLLISGNETKSFSHPQVGGAVTSLLAKFVESKALNPKEVDTLIRAMSEAFSTKSVKNKDGTTTQVRVPQGDLLKPIIGRPAAEQIAFLQKQFFPQDKSTFNNRGETMDRLAQTLATLPSVIKNKDYFQKFFGNPEMKMTGKDFTREILKLTDEPMTRGANGESLGYGKIIAALEVPQNQPMIAKAGGHEGFPMDYRSDAGKGKNTPAVMSVFEVPRRIIDMVNPAHGNDVSTHYIAGSGKLRSTSELLMNTTSTFGEGVVRESSHEMRKDTLNKATTKEKTLAGDPKFKVSDEVKSAASKAGYTILGSHQTNGSFNVFDINAKPVNRGGNPAGFYFSTVSGGTEYAGGRKITAFLKMDNEWKGKPSAKDKSAFIEFFKKKFNYDSATSTHQEYLNGKMDRFIKDGKSPSNINGNEFAEFLMSRGYDGFRDGSDVIVFNPEQVKSADDFTFDDQGNKIAIEKRFDKNNKDIRYKVSDYEGGDSYFKPKSNPFESKDEQGFLVRKSGVKTEEGFKSNPEFVDWFDIGHFGQNKGSPELNKWEKRNSGLWLMDEKTGIDAVNPILEFDNPDFTHNQWIPQKYPSNPKKSPPLGRYENPRYGKNGELIERGRISINSPSKKPVESMAEARKIKSELAKKLGFKEDDFDAFLFNANPEVKQSMGLGAKDQLQIKFKASDEKVAQVQQKASPDLSPFEGNFKVSDVVKKGVIGLDEIIGRLAKTDNISPSLRDAMKALKDAVRKQDATDEVLIPELREAYDTMVRSIDDQMAGASLTPIDSLKEIQKALKPLDKKIQKNSERVQKNARDAQKADMVEGADIESQGIQERQAANRRDMEEGASLESDQATAEIDRKRGNARLDMEEGASLDADEATARIQETVQDTNDGADIEAGQTQASRQNLPRQFPNPAPPIPEGLPSYKPSNTPAFPRPPATPSLPQVKPSGAVPFPRPPTAPAVPRGSVAPPPPQGTPAPAGTPFPNLPPSKPMGKLEGWRGWTLEKGLNGGFWKNAVGWMIVVQGDKFKVYNPQRAMQGIYEDLEQAKRRVQRAEPKQ